LCRNTFAKQQKLPHAEDRRGNQCFVRHRRVTKEPIVPKAMQKLVKPRRIGRPPAELTPAQVRRLASFAHTLPEIAAILEVSLRTVNRRMKAKEFADAFAEGQELAKAEVKRQLFKAGRKGSTKALVFLANNLLGWSDKVSTTLEQQVNFVVEIPAPLNADEWTQVYGNGKPLIDATPAKVEK
jgi:hypothetical protein